MTKRILLFTVLISFVSCITTIEDDVLEEEKLVIQYGTRPDDFELKLYSNHLSINQLETGDFISFEFKERVVDIVQYIGGGYVNGFTIRMKGKMSFYYIIQLGVIECYKDDDIVYTFDLQWFENNFS